MGRDLDELDPQFRERVDEMYATLARAGVTMRPFFTGRHPAEQARLWRQSRTRQQVEDALRLLRREGAPWLAHVLDSVGPQHGRRVTGALPGLSWHQWGLAVDSYWLVQGAAEWDTTTLGARNGYAMMANVARAMGLKPGADFGDSAHVQATPHASPLNAGRTWAEIDAEMLARWGEGAPLPVPG